MRKINLLLFLILVTLSSYAQDSLRFTKTSYSVSFADTSRHFTIIDSIYNSGSTFITGDSVTVGASLNGLPHTDTSLQNAPPSVLPTDTLFPGIVNYKLVTVTVDSAPAYQVGPNTIVIWPIVHHNGVPVPAVTDSIYVNVTYSRITGIAGIALLRMYIFQTQGHLNVNFGDAENLVQQVRIYDILGQGIYTGAPDRSKNIPTTGWNKGIYLCEITTLSGEKRTIKFRLE